MTVKDLIQKLETMDSDTDVVFVCDDAKCINADIYFSSQYDAIVVEVD